MDHCLFVKYRNTIRSAQTESDQQCKRSRHINHHLGHRKFLFCTMTSRVRSIDTRHRKVTVTFGHFDYPSTAGDLNVKFTARFGNDGACVRWIKRRFFAHAAGELNERGVVFFEPLLDLEKLSENVLIVCKFCMHLCAGNTNLTEVGIINHNLRMDFACIFTKDQTDVTRIC